MQRKLAIIMFVLLSTGLFILVGGVSAQETAEGDWETMESNNFVIEYQSSYDDDAEYIADVAENAYDELPETLPEHVSDISFDNPVHIRVYPGDEWTEDEWTLFWQDTDPVRIHVQAPSDSEPDDDWYDHGIAHELGNMFLWDEAGQYEKYDYYDRNPSWFHQGLTEYYVYKTPTVEPQFPPWAVEDLNETIKSDGGSFTVVSDDMYHGGHLISMYMVDTYGEDAVWDVLRSDEQTWDEAIEDGLGVDSDTFEENWYRWAENNIGGDYSQYYSDSAEDELDESEESSTEDELDESEENSTEDELEETEEKLEEVEERLEELEEESEEAGDTNGDQEGQSEDTLDDETPGFGFVPALLAIAVIMISRLE